MGVEECMGACYLMWMCQWEGRVTSCGYRTVSHGRFTLIWVGLQALRPGRSCPRDHKICGLPMWCGVGLPLHH